MNKKNKHYDPKKTIFISEKNRKTWAEIKNVAVKDEKGVGSFLCKMWRIWGAQK